MTLDCLLILSGESLKNFPRSKKAVEVYKNYERQRIYLPVIASGKGPGMDIPESEYMKEYLIDEGIREQDIHCETNSLDTLANFVYSAEFLDKLNVKNVGLITEPFHMKRSLNFGKKVLGDKYKLIPINSYGRKSTLPVFVKEELVTFVLGWDIRKIKTGDVEAFKEYLKKSHARHGKNPKGLYKHFLNSYVKFTGAKIS